MLASSFPSTGSTPSFPTDQSKAFQTIDASTHAGKWRVIFFWPMDFTFVCPTEIAAFGKLDKEFRARDAQLLGASTDSQFVHLAWRRDKEELRDLPFPMLADIKRELSTRWASWTRRRAWRSGPPTSSIRRA